MISIRTGIILLALTVAMDLLAGQAIQNPYANAKVGDWVKLRVTTTLAGTKTESIYKRTVISASETEIVTEVENTTNGKVDVSKTSISIDTPRPVILTLPTAKITSTSSGFERLRAAGRDLVCALTVQSDVEEVKVGQIFRTVKTWTSADVPLDGVVRTELERNSTLKNSKVKPPTEKIIVELIEFGRK